MKIKKMKISEIKPYDNNPRKNEEAIPYVKELIEKYGYLVPIVVNRDGVVVAGHTRLKALAGLGYEEVDVIVCDIDEEKEREYRILDNRIHELSEWDKGSLYAEMKRYLEDIDSDALLNMYEDLDKEINRVAVSEVFDVDMEAIEEAERNLEDEFKHVSEDFERSLVEVKCKGCGRKFFVKGE